MAAGGGDQFLRSLCVPAQRAEGFGEDLFVGGRKVGVGLREPLFGLLFVAVAVLQRRLKIAVGQGRRTIATVLVHVSLRGFLVARERLGEHQLVLQEAAFVRVREAVRAAKKFLELLAALGVLALPEAHFRQVEARRPQAGVFFDGLGKGRARLVVAVEMQVDCAAQIPHVGLFTRLAGVGDTFEQGERTSVILVVEAVHRLPVGTGR